MRTDLGKFRSFGRKNLDYNRYNTIVIIVICTHSVVNWLWPGGGGGFATATIANCVATYMLIWPMYILFVI